MKEFLKDWKVHALCGVMVLAAELIGLKSFAFGPISFFDVPYALYHHNGCSAGGFQADTQINDGDRVPLHNNIGPYAGRPFGCYDRP